MAFDAPPMMANGVRDRLARGDTVVSLVVRFVDSIDIVTVLKTAGFDSFYVDLEHGFFSLAAAVGLLQAGLMSGITPFVRVPSHEPGLISRLLDGGALGVIVPHVTSAAEAHAAVRAAKYPPAGTRSASGALPHFAYRGVPASAAMPAIDRATSVVVMIESRQALERADDIAAVEGVDMLLVGAGDLSMELDVAGQMSSSVMAAAHETVLAACKKHGKAMGLGGLAGEPGLIARYVGLGARYISSGTDLDLLRIACSDRCNLIRRLLEPGAGR